ncbi:MAG: utilization protein GntX [Gemmataceae bacterium]|nr:utilization protein GntX [Gemmataceae bacterium]
MWLRGFAELARGVAQLIYPNACLICDSPEADGTTFRHGLCSECVLSVTTDSSDVCPRCASTVGPHTDVSGGCMACRPRSFGFARTIRLGPYEGRLRDAILRMKLAPGEPLAEMMGRIFAGQKAAVFKAASPDVVVPIPLHWRRRWGRGYNQAQAMALELAGALRLPCQPAWLRRRKATPQHAQPSATARQENIRGAFRLGRRARPASRTVLLVDDVMTTGSTVGEAARVFREAGAAAVLVAVLARA